MSVYDIYGNQLSTVYDIYGNQLSEAYDINGIQIYSAEPPWEDEINIQKLRDTNTGTNYYLIRIPQVRSNGDKQYPFLYAPNGIGQATQSALAMNRQKGFKLATNAGVGGTYTVAQGVLPIGCLIENSVLLQQATSSFPILTINNEGFLDYAEPNTDGQTLINSGVVSACVGFVPIIVNYEAVDPSVYEPMPHDDQQAQRQIIGQFSNGDYAIVTAEGRGFDNSAGWTIPQAIAVCLSHGLRFAYNLDGGGSTETVIGDEQLNTIYENETGRKVQNYIVFNGTDRFFVPSEQN